MLFFLLFSLNAEAACDWKTIIPGPNRTFVYTEVCHQEVGKLVQANKDLASAVQLKDLAITNADARTQLWMTTSENMENRLQKMDSSEKSNGWLMFGLGALTVLGAGFMAAKLLHP